jgi:hypothetical protein
MPVGLVGGRAPARHDPVRAGRFSFAAAALLMLAALPGCERSTEPIEHSYLAIVALLDTPSGISPGTRYGYRVREVSGTLGIDTAMAVGPADTVILSMPVATYQVELTGLPTWCASRYGADQYVAVFEAPSTALARYYVTCRAPLTVQVSSEGPAPPDSEIVYRLAGGGISRLGILHPNDTLRFDGLAAGTYEFGLSLIAEQCVVTSDGGTHPRIVITEGGGAVLELRISCSDPARRPRFLHAAASYHDGVSGFVFRVFDPDRDVERYAWDLTDCAGTSVLPGGARLRRGLSSGRTRDQDTITVLGVYEPGLSASEVARRCTALRVADQLGNTTPVLELPILATPGIPPAATMFNAYSVGTVAIRTDLAVQDIDGDFVGVFATARVRDGVLFGPDGNPDIGIYTVAGDPGPNVQDLPLGSRIQYGDVYAVIVYLIDAAGHFTRLEDSDVLR